MRKPYLARLTNLQAQIIAAPASESGQLIRQFLAHEASTARNIRRAHLLTNEFLILISTSNLSSLTGSLPYSDEYVLSTIYVKSDQVFIVQIFNLKSHKVIYHRQSYINQ